MFFGSNRAKARVGHSRFSGRFGRSAARRVVSSAARREIEQLEQRWLLASPNAFSVNFIGNNGAAGISMDPGDVAGVVPEGNYNNITTASDGGSAMTLLDNTGSSAAGVTMNWTAPGFWSAV